MSHSLPSLSSDPAADLVAAPGTPLYVHVPYCVAKCTYCDFYSVEAEGYDVPAVVGDLLAEATRRAPRRPRTVFLGGGTPSYLAAEDLTRLLDGLHERTGFRDSAEEVTVECNPESLDETKARRLLDLGVDRLSIGIQSLDPGILKLFGRVHDVEQGFAALDAARSAGCRNVSVDLIYGVPGQELAPWLRDLARILERRPDHVSAYHLAFEEGTLMTHWMENGSIQPLDEERQLAFFEATRAALAAQGYDAYEVSNFSLKGHRCRHNEHYWQNGPYVGIGPSAVSKIGLTRFGNPRSVNAWTRGVRDAGHAVDWQETPPADVRLGETWWLGLRTTRGVDPREARSTARFEAALDPAEEQALDLASMAFLERASGCWRLTPRGLPLADAISRRFLADSPAEPGVVIPGQAQRLRSGGPYMARKKRRPKKRRGGLQGIFFRGLVTVLPVVLTVVVFGLMLQGLNQYVVAPINRAIYWTLEHNALGWQALEWIGIDPTDRKYLDEPRLPVDLRDLVRASPAGTQDPAFIEGLAEHREPHLDLLYDFDDLAIDRARLRDDVKAAVHPLVGVAVSVLVVVWLGWLVGGFLGRQFMQRVDRALHLIPIVKSVYPYSKQLVDFFFADNELEFDTVVAIPYPSKGLWSLAFVTSSSMRTLRETTGETLITCFIPSSPMPMTGYTIFLPADKVIQLDLTVDEALRVTMTGGVLIPPKERVREPAEIRALFETAVEDLDDEPPSSEPPGREAPGKEAIGE